MAEQQRQPTREEIDKLRSDAIKMQMNAQRSLDQFAQKEEAAKANNQELSKLDKVMKGLAKFGAALGKAAERAANSAARKQR